MLSSSEKRRLRSLRARARLRGVGVQLSRRALSADNLGGFRLTDLASNTLIDGSRYDLTLTEAEDRVAGIITDLNAASLTRSADR